ncbi:MAG: pectate lyase [Candidatus Latescibacteria bacterium]|nr:pectate lyase [Candidatus Latescibacterota bacterium]
MNRIIRLTILVFAFFFPINSIYTEPREKDVLAAMRKAADFLANTVSNKGGYVFLYSEDLTRRWGEIPARDTQIWVQPPGTPAVGMMFLKAYKATGDHAYLDYAEKAANALIWGQHPAGGWHYLIDFDMTGIRKWYDEAASKCWGWEEYLQYYGNCSFDDYTTSAPIRFLLELYMTTLNPKYRTALLKAMDFILEAQYPNGAWPQRYPLRYDYPHDGHADYTHYYTFNDDVISDNINLLLEAWEKLGNETYREAAYRAMEFYIISQLPKPQAGWAQQYTMNMKPGWGRSYEPDAVCTVQTTNNIRDLQKFYKITGDRRFLRPIPDALEWLEGAILTSGLPEGKTHAYFYELGTNKPLWSHRSGTSIEDGHYWVDYNITNLYPYGVPLTIDITQLKKEYERVCSLSSQEASAEYIASIQSSSKTVRIDSGIISEIIESLDSRGAWINDLSIPHYFGDVFNEPAESIRGINMSEFLQKMYTLIDYYAQNKSLH